ncbi:aminoglycoside 3'-phosphotransferase [Microcella humidisoli]|uniref:Aminoglycoside 3'-phosphotransferase n=1 Tax=Microcella humidisoli TaxID=2963406 RepID=A0ABY5FW39_9MICO|nr:aminoglycoside 3'-phosphotransferase [Microcella humidisoli]UTT62529.1 aminoglycoside 3'-phosphotransferase [Microcella humidisoli]
MAPTRKNPEDAARLLPGSGWEKVASGESDTDVYRRDAVYAKVCAADGTVGLAEERDRVRWLAETDFPGARVLDWIDSQHGAVLVTSAVSGVPGWQLPCSPTLMGNLAAALRSFHELPVEGCPFERRLEDVLGQVEDVVRRGAVNPDFLSLEWQQVPPAELLSRLQTSVPAVQDLVVCHGDATLANFLFDPQTLAFTGAVDVGHLGVADRYSDLALTAAQVVNHGWSPSSVSFLTMYGLDDADDERLVFYLLLDAMSWG